MKRANEYSKSLAVHSSSRAWKAMLISLAVFVFSYLFLFQIPGVFSKSRLVLSFFIGLAIGTLFFILAKCNDKTPNQSRVVYKNLVLAALLYSSVYALLFHLPSNYALAPRGTVRIEISAVEQGGGDVQIEGLYNGITDVSLKTMTFEHATLEKDQLWLKPAIAQPAVIQWQGQIWEQVRLHFNAETSGIPIRLSLNGQNEVLDSKTGSFFAYLIPENYSRIRLISSLSMFFSFILFVFSMLLMAVEIQGFFREIIQKVNHQYQPKSSISKVPLIKKWIEPLFQKKEAFLFWFLLLIGVFVRVVSFGEIPGGLHVDEAMAGYQAWSLLKYGIDLHGFHFPMYFVAYGGGMSALPIYMMMPLIAIIGLNNVAVRLPQLIFSIATLVVFYHTAKLMRGKTFALIALALLVINPWHIMLSRWGLESNMLPFFLLLTIYFLARGMQDRRFLVPACLAAGVGLYAYALGWVSILIILFGFFVFTISIAKTRLAKEHVFGALLFLILFLPIVLFVLVNTGRIEAINGTFSIPRLTEFRSGEISFQNISENLREFTHILITQYDGLIWNSIGEFGIFYKFGLPLILVGLITQIQAIISAFRNKKVLPDVLIGIWLVAALTIPLMTKVNIYRANALWLPCIYLCAVGVEKLFKLKNIHINLSIAALFGISFLLFSNFYFFQYPQRINEAFGKSFDQALHFAKSKTAGQITLSTSMNFGRVLFYDQMPPQEFIDTVEYENIHSKYLKPIRFGRYVYQSEKEPIQKNVIYVLSNHETQPFVSQGFSIAPFEYFSVAYNETE